jgi:hypothetical protein
MSDIVEDKLKAQEAALMTKAGIKEQPVLFGHLQNIISPAFVIAGLAWWGCTYYVESKILAAKIDIENICRSEIARQYSPTPAPRKDQ